MKQDTKLNKPRTAQGGLVVYDAQGIREVTSAGVQAWKALKCPHNLMLITENRGLRKVAGGTTLEFTAVLSNGKSTIANIFIGNTNRIAEWHARILRCDKGQLDKRPILLAGINNLVGRVIGYEVKGRYVRPKVASKTMRLDAYLATVQSLKAAKAAPKKDPVDLRTLVSPALG